MGFRPTRVTGPIFRRAPIGTKLNKEVDLTMGSPNMQPDLPKEAGRRRNELLKSTAPSPPPAPLSGFQRPSAARTTTSSLPARRSTSLEGCLGLLVAGASWTTTNLQAATSDADFSSDRRRFGLKLVLDDR